MEEKAGVSICVRKAKVSVVCQKVGVLFRESGKQLSPVARQGGYSHSLMCQEDKRVPVKCVMKEGAHFV